MMESSAFLSLPESSSRITLNYNNYKYFKQSHLHPESESNPKAISFFLRKF